MHRLRRLSKARKGATLVEFAVGALLLVVVLLATLEFGLELHARNTNERVANRATEAYASTRDLAVVADVIDARTDVVLERCLYHEGREVSPSPLRIVLFDSVASIDPLRDPGREADGTAADDTAVAFRLELRCRWPRITPAFGGILGSPLGYTSTGFARLRVGAGP